MEMSSIFGSTCKGKSRLLLLCGLGFFLFRLEAQEPAKSDSLRLYQSAMERGEFYLAVDRPRGHGYDSLRRYASIDRITAGKAIVYTDLAGYQRLKELKLDLELLRPPSLEHPIRMSGGTFPGSWDRYPSYQEYLDLMREFTTGFPALCHLDTIGYSAENRLLLVLTIAGRAEPGFQPSFFYTSTMHGDEVAGYVILLRLADHLLNAYGLDPEITDLLDRVSICINPLANPDGSYAQSDTSLWGATRFNSQGIDLNRNFPDPSGTRHPDGRDWAPETVAMMDYMEEKGFQMSCNLHGGAEVVNYPWDTWSRLHADNQWFVMISRAYADTVHTRDPDYLTDQDNGITNGYAWYEVDGSRQDYTTYYLRGREITLEILEDKIPEASFLPTLWNLNRSSLIQLVEKATRCLRGRVLDSITGEVLHAEIRHELDRDHSSVFSDRLTGMYFRYLSGGSYTFTASAEGYTDKTVPVAFMDPGSRNLDFLLTPATEPENGFAVRLENPVGDRFKLDITLPRAAPVHILLYDLQGRLCKDYGEFDLLEGDNEIDIHSTGLGDGVYILRIEIPGVPGIRYRQKIIKVRIN